MSIYLYNARHILIFEGRMKKKIFKSLLVVLAIPVIYLVLLFLFEVYLKHEYVNECILSGKTKDWCKQTWVELRMME